MKTKNLELNVIKNIEHVYYINLEAKTTPNQKFKSLKVIVNLFNP